MEISLQQKLTINWYNRALRKLDSDFFFTLEVLPKNFHTHHRLYRTKVVFPQSFGPKYSARCRCFLHMTTPFTRISLGLVTISVGNRKKTEKKNLAEVSIIFRYLMLFVTIFECSAAQSLAICFTLKDGGNMAKIILLNQCSYHYPH